MGLKFGGLGFGVDDGGVRESEKFGDNLYIMDRNVRRGNFFFEKC